MNAAMITRSVFLRQVLSLSLMTNLSPTEQ
jgi:hypothetical protein